MNGPVIRVQGLSKRYKIYSKPWRRLLEWATLNRAKHHTDFWALRDVDLTVGRAECIGVIGPNGAGKSTLLKILSGTAGPSAGSYQIQGRVLSLLELGTGFLPTLTGRQNVVETSSLLGFPPGYVEERMTDIQAFAELHEFFDRPIRTYSSGMVVRLAFSMFVFLEPDVFIVDEALAVGDAGFQRKCYSRIDSMLARGVTCLLVTHDLPAVIKFCHRAVVLYDGRKIFEGDPRQACNVLSKIYFGDQQSASITDYGDGSAVIEEIWFEDVGGQRISSSHALEPVVFCYTIFFKQAATEPICGMHIKTIHGVEVTLASTDYLHYEMGSYQGGERVTLRWVLDLTLNPGTYFFGCGVKYHDRDLFMSRRVDAMRFPIADVQKVGGVVNPIRELRLDHSPQPRSESREPEVGAGDFAPIAVSSTRE